MQGVRYTYSRDQSYANAIVYSQELGSFCKLESAKSSSKDVMKKYLLIYKHAIVMHVSTIVKNTICRYHWISPKTWGEGANLLILQ